jgi:hypothetical protein
MDRLPTRAPESPKAIPVDVKAKLDRGRKSMLGDAGKRRLCIRFRKGDSYWFEMPNGMLNHDASAAYPTGTAKPGHRIRNKYDQIGPIIDAKVSAATSRIPDYQVNASTPDLEDVGAATLSAKVARYGYDQWRVRKASKKAVDLAIGGGGRSFAMPYFDPNVGPYTLVEGKWVGRGEIKVLVLNGNQMYSEPGVDFNDSPWYAIERARPLDEVQQIPGFVRGDDKLIADASTSDIPSDRETSDNLLMVTEYFERPCPKYPQGRCMTFANGRPIVDYRKINPTAENAWGPYPLIDTDGTVFDEPIAEELYYRQDLEDGSDLGLTWALIDYQRTVQDCWNKQLEWKNRCLNPQMLAPINSLIDSPG